MTVARENAVQALLAADAALTALLTGGVYARHALGKQGLKDTNPLSASAYALDDGFDVLQPCVVARIRSNVMDGNRFDTKTQVISATGTLELYFYDESGFTTIAQARARAYALLHAKTLANIGVCTLINQMQYYDEALHDAATLKDDYRLTYLQS